MSQPRDLVSQFRERAEDEGLMPGTPRFEYRMLELRVERCQEAQKVSMCQDCKAFDNCEIAKEYLWQRTYVAKIRKP